MKPHPCTVHRCCECCKETEMTLTEEDLQRIKDQGYNDFYFINDGYFQLRNVNGRCYFLKDGRCSIYENRPDGCRYYPIILDLGDDRTYLHDFCKYRDEFNFTSAQKNALRRLVHRELKERDSRVGRGST